MRPKRFGKQFGIRINEDDMKKIRAICEKDQEMTVSMFIRLAISEKLRRKNAKH